MTLNEERRLPEARRRLKGVSATEGDERQVWLEEGDRSYWFLFRMESRAWRCTSSATYSTAAVNDDKRWQSARQLR